MTLAFQSLLMMVLLVSGAVAVLPVALREARPRAAAPLPAGSGPSRVWIVETSEGRWLFEGVPRTATELKRLWRRQPRPRRIHYLPSNALSLRQVSRSLRRLRGLTSAAVVLDLPPADRRRWP